MNNQDQEGLQQADPPPQDQTHTDPPKLSLEQRINRLRELYTLDITTELVQHNEDQHFAVFRAELKAPYDMNDPQGKYWFRSTGWGTAWYHLPDDGDLDLSYMQEAEDIALGKAVDRFMLLEDDDAVRSED